MAVPKIREMEARQPMNVRNWGNQQSAGAPLAPAQGLVSVQKLEEWRAIVLGLCAGQVFRNLTQTRVILVEGP